MRTSRNHPATSQPTNRQHPAGRDAGTPCPPRTWQPGSTISDGGVMVNDVLVAREASPNGTGDNWDNFDMVKINNMYRISLAAFLKLYHATLKDAGHQGSSGEKRIEALKQTLQIKVETVVATPEALTTLMQPRFKPLIMAELEALGADHAIAVYESYANPI